MRKGKGKEKGAHKRNGKGGRERRNGKGGRERRKGKGKGKGSSQESLLSGLPGLVLLLLSPLSTPLEADFRQRETLPG